MKILGIGNAIVDVICKVEDSFITDNGLTKSTMKLVDEAEFKKLLSSLKIEETVETILSIVRAEKARVARYVPPSKDIKEILDWK